MADRAIKVAVLKDDFKVARGAMNVATHVTHFLELHIASEVLKGIAGKWFLVNVSH